MHLMFNIKDIIVNHEYILKEIDTIEFVFKSNLIEMVRI